MANRRRSQDDNGDMGGLDETGGGPLGGIDPSQPDPADRAFQPDPSQGDPSLNRQGPQPMPPIPPDVDPAHGSEGPRERNNFNGAGGNNPIMGPGITATPRRPTEPTSMAGSTSPAGIIPFNPMGSPDIGGMAKPMLRGLYGSAGGLKGGGLGTPLDPISNDQSDPISDLIKLLSQHQGNL